MQVEDVQALHEHLNNALKARIEEIKTRNNEAPIYTYRNLRTGNGDDISTWILASLGDNLRRLCGCFFFSFSHISIILTV